MGRALTAALAAAFALIAPGCASVLSVHGSGGRASTASATPLGFATGPAGAGAVAVIRAWSDALRRGDVHAAAHYFQIPSLFFDGGPIVELHSLRDAEAANEELPCGARLISASRHGKYVNALFELTQRPGPGGGCGSGAGQTARTFFLIHDGRIVEWLRVPDEPGDNGSPPPPASPQTPPRPTTPRTPGTPTAPRTPGTPTTPATPQTPTSPPAPQTPTSPGPTPIV
jgi:hypothetical protein